MLRLAIISGSPMTRIFHTDLSISGGMGGSSKDVGTMTVVVSREVSLLCCVLRTNWGDTMGG